AFTYNCASWTPTLSVKHKGTYSDVELIAAPNAKKHRCFLTGISGDWTATRNNGTVQPYAEIYFSGQSTRLRVAPTSGNDRVYAEASCVQIQPYRYWSSSPSQAAAAPRTWPRRAARPPARPRASRRSWW